MSREITVEILMKKNATVRFVLYCQDLLKATVGIWRSAGRHRNIPDGPFHRTLVFGGVLLSSTLPLGLGASLSHVRRWRIAPARQAPIDLIPAIVRR